MEVVGICGPSGSGKTTIARYLSSMYNTPEISQDKYGIEGSTNWEIPKSYNWREIVSRVRNSGNQIVVIEGFLLYTQPLLRQMINHKVYIYLPTDEVVRRRISRHNIEYRTTKEDYIRKTLWPYSEKYMLKQIGYSDLVVDGRENLHNITATILNFLNRRGVCPVNMRSG